MTVLCGIIDMTTNQVTGQCTFPAHTDSLWAFPVHICLSNVTFCK